MSMFLTQDEVTELTGIGRGKNGFTRNQLQITQLREMGIAFYVNAAGQPKIARSLIENGATGNTNKITSWQPTLLSNQKVA